LGRLKANVEVTNICKPLQANVSTKVCKKAFAFASQDRSFNIFLPSLKMCNTQTAKDRQRRNRAMTLNPNIDNGLQIQA
jgi:hypothetical protein